MKRKRHSSQQVIRKLGEAKAALASGQPLAAVCQMLGVSEQTYYRPRNWKKQYGNMDADEAKRLASLEDENRLPGVGSRSGLQIYRWTKRSSPRRWILQKTSKPDAATGDRPAGPASDGLFATSGVQDNGNDSQHATIDLCAHGSRSSFSESDLRSGPSTSPLRLPNGSGGIAD